MFRKTSSVERRGVGVEGPCYWSLDPDLSVKEDGCSLYDPGRGILGPTPGTVEAVGDTEPVVTTNSLG